MLPKVIVHKAFLRKKDGRDREKSGDSEGNKDSKDTKVTMDGNVVQVKTLADYVHSKKMEQVRESCRAAHGVWWLVWHRKSGLMT